MSSEDWEYNTCRAWVGRPAEMIEDCRQLEHKEKDNNKAIGDEVIKIELVVLDSSSFLEVICLPMLVS